MGCSVSKDPTYGKERRERSRRKKRLRADSDDEDYPLYEQSKMREGRRIRKVNFNSSESEYMDSDDDRLFKLAPIQSKLTEDNQQSKRHEEYDEDEEEDDDLSFKPPPRQSHMSRIDRDFKPRKMQSKKPGDDDDDDYDDDDSFKPPPRQSHMSRMDRHYKSGVLNIQSKKKGDSDDDDDDDRPRRKRSSRRGNDARMSRRKDRKMRREANDILESNVELYEQTRNLMRTCDPLSGMGEHIKALKTSYTSFNDFPYDIKSYYRSELYQPMLSTGSMLAVLEVLIQGLRENAYFTRVSEVKQVIRDRADLLSDCLQIVCNFTDTSPDIREMVSQHPVLLPLLVKKLDEWYQPSQTVLDIERKYINKTLALLYLMSAEDEKTHIQRLRNIPGFIQIMKRFMSSTSEDSRLTAIAALAGVVNEAEAEDIAADHEIVRFLLQQLQLALSSGISSAGWTVVGLSKVVKNLASNDANKQLLVQEGAVRLLLTGLGPDVQKSSNCLERKCCLESLWWLSFDEKNRVELMKETDLLDTVVSLYREGPSEDPSNCFAAAEGFLFQMREHLRNENKYREIADQLLNDIPDHVPETSGHVMMSYQTQQRPVVKMVCDFLKANGFTVWMDIYNMAEGEQSTLQTMAEAVEGAVVVAMCVSESYKNSPYCRAEAEYAFMKNKVIIPLKLQKGYSPDGWLGIIQGSKYFYDFTNEKRYEEKQSQLLEAVRKAFPGQSLTQSFDFTDGKQLSTIQTKAITTAPSPTPTPKPAASSFKDKVKTWTQADVQQWFSKYNLTGDKLAELSGEDLLYLHDLKSEAPEFYYNTVRNDLQLTGISTMASFNKALATLPTDALQC